VSAFFARHLETGEIYLMHDGSVGGGRKGIGREGYLAWIGARLVAVASSDGRTRDGVVVANINAAAAGKDIARFVESVADFKQAVKDGRADSPASRHARQTYKGYFDEFSGRKRGRLECEIEYVIRHGDIVKAIRDWRLKKSPPRSEIVKDALIDLGVVEDGILRELYEVKPSCNRYSLYTAIGQLFVHAKSDRLLMFCCVTQR
jgi:hypothetical protein